MKRRILLTVAYDGTNYCGWQVQPNGVSIQTVLQAAIVDLTGVPTDLTGASRTDSGVHAIGQRAVFDTEMQIQADRIPLAINQRLPKDISVTAAREVPPDFHPRYQRTEKTYLYRIWNSRCPDPIRRLYSYFVPRRLDVEAMRTAAGYLAGTHDFKNFASTKSDVTGTVRTIHRIALEQEGSEIRLEITGNGFLYNMVRIITGSLLKVGFGQKPPEWIRTALESEERLVPGPTAPAHGLTLVSIRYPDLEE